MTSHFKILMPFLLLIYVCGGCKTVSETSDSESKGWRGWFGSSLRKCGPSVLRQINGYDAKLDKNVFLTERGQTFVSAIKGPKSSSLGRMKQHASIDSSGFPEGPSISYSLAPCTAACDNPSSMIYMQKVNHHLTYIPRTSAGLAFDERRYIGFAMKYDGETPINEVILFQLWQGAPFTPPFAAVAFGENGKKYLKFVVRNDETGSNPSAVPHEIARIPLVSKGWYQIILSISPEHAKMKHRDGNTTLQAFVIKPASKRWEVAAKYHGKWGFDPMSSCHYAGKCDLGRKPNGKMDFKFGAYRKGDASHIKVTYDNLRLTKDFEAAMPSYECELD
jgi:hypothetical protein